MCVTRPRTSCAAASRAPAASRCSKHRVLQQRRWASHGGEQVPTMLQPLDVRLINQEPQLVTGHAVQQALPGLTGDTVLILYGDVPLTRLATLRALLTAAAGGKLALLTADLAAPSGYGRIGRDSAGRVPRPL